LTQALPQNYVPVLFFDTQNLITIPHAKLVRKLGALTNDQMLDVEDAVCDWLGF